MGMRSVQRAGEPSETATRRLLQAAGAHKGSRRSTLPMPAARHKVPSAAAQQAATSRCEEGVQILWEAEGEEWARSVERAR